MRNCTELCRALREASNITRCRVHSVPGQCIIPEASSVTSCGIQRQDAEVATCVTSGGLWGYRSMVGTGRMQHTRRTTLLGEMRMFMSHLTTDEG